MSKTIKGLIESDIKKRLEGVEGVAVLSPRGIEATKNNGIRGRLRQQGVRMLVVRNTLARRAVAGTKLAGFEKLLDGPSAVVFGDLSVPAIARMLMDEKKKDDKLELRGVFFDGELYQGEKGVEAASKLPTREEAIASVLAAILSPGRKLGGILKGQAGIVAALVKAVEEKKKAAEEAAGTAAAPEAGTAAPEAGGEAAPATA